jgi:hypothetical protein
MDEADPTITTSEPRPGEDGTPKPTDPDRSPFALPEIEEVERGLDPWRIDRPAEDD